MGEILTSLWVLLIGMVGIFAVMGVIFLALSILNYFNKSRKKDEPKQSPPNT